MEEYTVDPELSTKTLESLKILLMTCQEFSILPEILDIFGQESFLKFLDIFADQTIRVPSKRELLTAIRDCDIWSTVSNNSSEDVVKVLGDRYKLTPERVTDIYKEVVKKLGPYLSHISKKVPMEDKHQRSKSGNNLAYVGRI